MDQSITSYKTLENPLLSPFPLAPTCHDTENSPIFSCTSSTYPCPCPYLLMVAPNMQLLLHLVSQTVLLLRLGGRPFGLGVVDVLLWRLRIALVATGLKEKGCQL